jgi:hypothetical protein
VFSFSKRRSWRAATTWLLAAMQLHLLLVLALHHHILPTFSLGLSTTTTATVSQTHSPPQPANGEQRYCTACQILRHGAVRPSLGNPTPHRSTVRPLLAPRAATDILTAQLSAWYGRAPPLA